jgi:hypothetical protein
MSISSLTFTREASMIRIARILALLEEKPRTTDELAAALPCNKRTATVYVQALRGYGPIKRQVHTGAWRREPHTPQCPLSPVIHLGDLPDVPPPEKPTRAEVERRYRERVKRERPDRYMQMLAYARARSIKPRRDPMVAAFFGPPP